MRLGQNLSSFAPSPFAPEAPPSWILNPIPPAPRWKGKRQAKVQAQSSPQPQPQSASSLQAPSDVQPKHAKVRLKVRATVARSPEPLSKSFVLTSGESGALSVDDSRIPTITPSKTRCLITNTSVPAASMVTQPVVSNDKLGLADQFDTIRRQWCLPLGPPQECIDRLGGNQLCLRGDWAAMLSNHGWTLIPQTHVLLDITRKLICLKTRKKNAHPRDIIQHNYYTYTFVALQLEGIQITRETASGDAVFSPPYADFPTLLLPLHPYLAIHHALVAFDKHEPVTDEHILIHNNLLRIRKLWEELEWYRDKTLVNLALKKDMSPSAQDKVDEKRKSAVDPYPTPAKRACHP
ncbi:hypothetical protein K474DRAFT_1771179 [Panus rudis PR-1116 ss-1]|nr:hypothetical protein K474DRAFT_1771179 [Panus rudis PR-1116 ss-1]